jgi:hypothetical protein
VRSLSSGVLGIRSLFALAIALLLFVESLLRLLRLSKDGRTSGSVLGVLIKPLYDKAIKDRPALRS